MEQQEILNRVAIHTKTSNKHAAVIYDSSIFASKVSVDVGNKKTGHIIFAVKTEHQDLEFNLILEKKEALAIVAAMVCAIKSQDTAILGGGYEL